MNIVLLNSTSNDKSGRKSKTNKIERKKSIFSGKRKKDVPEEVPETATVLNSTKTEKVAEAKPKKDKTKAKEPNKVATEQHTDDGLPAPQSALNTKSTVHQAFGDGMKSVDDMVSEPTPDDVETKADNKQPEAQPEQCSVVSEDTDDIADDVPEEEPVKHAKHKEHKPVEEKKKKQKKTNLKEKKQQKAEKTNPSKEEEKPKTSMVSHLISVVFVIFCMVVTFAIGSQVGGLFLHWLASKGV